MRFNAYNGHKFLLLVCSVPHILCANHITICAYVRAYFILQNRKKTTTKENEYVGLAGDE